MIVTNMQLKGGREEDLRKHPLKEREIAVATDTGRLLVGDEDGNAMSLSGVEEAPVDGAQYARQDGAYLVPQCPHWSFVRGGTKINRIFRRSFLMKHSFVYPNIGNKDKKEALQMKLHWLAKFYNTPKQYDKLCDYVEQKSVIDEQRELLNYFLRAVQLSPINKANRFL